VEAEPHARLTTDLAFRTWFLKPPNSHGNFYDGKGNNKANVLENLTKQNVYKGVKSACAFVRPTGLTMVHVSFVLGK